MVDHNTKEKIKNEVISKLEQMYPKIRGNTLDTLIRKFENTSLMVQNIEPVINEIVDKHNLESSDKKEVYTYINSYLSKLIGSNLT